MFTIEHVVFSISCFHAFPHYFLNIVQVKCQIETTKYIPECITSKVIGSDLKKEAQNGYESMIDSLHTNRFNNNV